MNKALLVGVSGAALLFAASAQASGSVTTSQGLLLTNEQGQFQGGELDADGGDGGFFGGEGGDADAEGVQAQGQSQSVGAFQYTNVTLPDITVNVPASKPSVYQYNKTFQSGFNKLGDIELSTGDSEGGRATGGDLDADNRSLTGNLGAGGSGFAGNEAESSEGGEGAGGGALSGNLALQGAAAVSVDDGEDAEGGQSNTANSTSTANGSGGDGGDSGDVDAVAKAFGGDNTQSARSWQSLNAATGGTQGGDGGNITVSFSTGGIGGISVGTMSGIANIAQNTGLSANQFSSFSINANTH